MQATTETKQHKYICWCRKYLASEDKAFSCSNSEAEDDNEQHCHGGKYCKNAL